MRVGFVYDAKEDYRVLGLPDDAIAEFDDEKTLHDIAATLTGFGFTVDRIGNLQALVKRLAQGQTWDIVFNCAEGLYGSAREATVPALLDAYQIPYVFSDAVTMALTLDKSIAKRLVAAAGVPTAEYTVLESAADLRAISLPYPLFAKPIAEGSGKGVLATSHVNTHEQLTAVFHELTARFRQPILVETYLPGREFTVGILGSGEKAHVIGVAEIGMMEGVGVDGQFNSYHNKQNALETYALATDAEAIRAGDVALAAWRVLGGKDAGRIDIRSDAKGEPHFLEVNPLAGLQEGYSELPILAALADVPYRTLIESIMRAAMRRHGLVWPQEQAA